MSRHRSIFLHGLFLTIRRLPAVLWTYLISLGLALLFSLRLHAQLGEVLNHSLYTQRLVGGFDLGGLTEAIGRIYKGPAPLAGNSSGVPLYVLIFFILTPGVLFCYLTSAPARLSTLFQQGLLHFWRFVRITILALITFGIILGPLYVLAGKWADHVDRHAVGRHAFFVGLIGYILLFLVATILRLYFDLVEVYTVQLGLHQRNNGKPDRRVRRTLRPAWRTLRAHFSQAWPIFLFLTLIGAAAVILTARISMHMLAQPRMWPSFLLAQCGLFILLFTRFWQRGAETSLALEHPVYPPTQLPIRPVVPYYPPPPPPIPTQDPIPNPEPASPSLDEPDPGVFHRNPNEPV
jgi:hypothetical protein